MKPDSGRPSRDGVLLLHFGEPASDDLGEATAYLERIFRANARLEAGSPAERERRIRELAARRAPALAHEYRRIGGSPLDRQAFDQGRAVVRALEARGRNVAVETGMQYTQPDIETALAGLRSAGVERLVVLPVYPLCGPSTTIAALEEATAARGRLGWAPDMLEVTGWHRHPAYAPLRARTIREAADRAGLDPRRPDVELVFAAHGTPLAYVRAGSRYVEYVEDVCRRIAGELGIGGYTLGYQNHANRGIEWTAPDVDAAIASLPERTAVIVDAPSFLHEQSETLAELDLDLRARAESRGLRFVRVPIPHDAPEVATILADLVEAALGAPGREPARPGACRCRPGAAVCLNR